MTLHSFFPHLSLGLVTKMNLLKKPLSRGGSRTAETPKMERFVIIFNGFQPLTTITKSSILNVAAVLDPPLASDSG